MEVCTDRRWRFDAEPEAVWAAISDVSAYQQRWPWLTHFDAAALAPNERWRCELHPRFVPYRLTLVITILEVESSRRVSAEVSGDISGRAEVTLAPEGSPCEVRLVSTLRPERGVIRALARLAPWLARAGHDRVLTTGARQLDRTV